MRKGFIYCSALLTVTLLVGGFWVQWIWFLLLVVLPLVALGFYDLLQRKHTVLRNFPLLGHFRYLFEEISPEIQQYFIERHTDGTPISRNHRSVVYKRAKDRPATHPFGTERDPYSARYVGLRHSLYPRSPLEEGFRVTIGGPDCRKPYAASLLNISAMSFGSISDRAILAMGKGAKEGGFYQNTGEGSVSEYHVEAGGDLVWQIGTGYFGCRTPEGGFDAEAFREKANWEVVKMVELKLSQGAKPGHGGVLPKEKNNAEIARIRMVEPGTTVESPQGHREFRDAEGLLRFIAKLRRLSGGKPIGIKLCIGREEEFRSLCETMVRRGSYPDFITVDGAEGGTGAAPLEFTDSVGMPLEPALRFVRHTLVDLGIRERIKVIASGKIVTAFDIVRVLAYGADLCNSARAFMLATGCIQALRCNTNRCPTGVTTLDPRLTAGLVVEDKYKRVANFHRNTLRAARELMAGCGVSHPRELDESVFLRGVEWQHLGGSGVG
ncbi:FMN-binding glutamate synthase family protein [Pelagicoccus sp. SDUM812005]|uniref:FMN-binding glutamate synthase family protein n=1 Tax=Pelagicoccus sp. SDUM812005 TaxID=3041257 RepID=UPI00280D5AA0|nr:FMN-binding glutamate synthase family protein [Pelagicoccus sp. SDUM812005]MDQ8181068.1 FMN-binding glutamate synthase family protein [Pelagicoccus sp. SDUM812005]